MSRLSTEQRQLILLFAVMACGLAGMGRIDAIRAGSPMPPPTAKGELGSELEFLRSHCTGPREPGESNCFIDLWAEQNLRKLALESGLTNNHALFINSHGLGVLTARGMQYAYQPHQSLLHPGEKAPFFSAADVAKVLGPGNVASIHNVLISGCNADAAFSAKQLRQLFVNATNFVHMPAGKFGYQSMFFQALTRESSQIKPLYETAAKNQSGKTEFFLENTPSASATQLSPYIAELFKPGSSAPFKTQLAGRELLVPGQRPCLVSKTAPSSSPHPERGCLHPRDPRKP